MLSWWDTNICHVLYSHSIIIWYRYFLTVHIIIVNCTVPVEPCNGAIVDHERLNETVLEGTVLTYQCDNGLSLTGPNTITCTNAGVWSTEPEAIMCVSPTEGEGHHVCTWMWVMVRNPIIHRFHRSYCHLPIHWCSCCYQRNYYFLCGCHSWIPHWTPSDALLLS